MVRGPERRLSASNTGWLGPVAKWLGQGVSRSGRVISEATAFNYSAVYCACTVISNAVKTVPLRVMVESDGKKTVASGSVVDNILHRRPNADMTPSAWKGWMQVSALLWDAGYSAIVRDRQGRPTSVSPIHASRVKPDRDEDGALFFRVRNDDLSEIHVDNRDMLRIYGTSRDGISGTSLLHIARESLGLSGALEDHGAAFFANGATPGGVLTHPGKLEETQVNRLRASWQSRFGGTENINKTAILEGGVDYKPIGMPNEVSQFLESRVFQIEEIARFWNVPLSKLKQLLNAKFDNMEQQSLEFDADTMLPWWVTWEEEINIKLLDGGAKGRYAKFRNNALMRADSTARSEFYGKMINNGVMTPNQANSLEDMDPYEGGDNHFMQGAMTTVEEIINRPAPTVDAPDPQPGNSTDSDDLTGGSDDITRKMAESYESLLTDAFGRIITREAERVRRAMKKHGHDNDSMEEWIGKFFDDHEAFVRRTLESPVGAMRPFVKRWRSSSTMADEFVLHFRKCVSARNGTLLAILGDVLDERTKLAGSMAATESGYAFGDLTNENS